MTHHLFHKMLNLASNAKGADTTMLNYIDMLRKDNIAAVKAASDKSGTDLYLYQKSQVASWSDRDLAVNLTVIREEIDNRKPAPFPLFDVHCKIRKLLNEERTKVLTEPKHVKLLDYLRNKGLSAFKHKIWLPQVGCDSIPITCKTFIGYSTYTLPEGTSHKHVYARDKQ